MSTTSSAARAVWVQVPEADVVSLGGTHAEVVALLALAGLSERTLRLVAAVVAEEARLGAIAYGRAVVDLQPGAFRLTLEDIRPRVVVKAPSP